MIGGNETIGYYHEETDKVQLERPVKKIARIEQILRGPITTQTFQQKPRQSPSPRNSRPSGQHVHI